MADVKEVYFLCPVCRELVPLEDVEYREVTTSEFVFELDYNKEYGELEYNDIDYDTIEILEKYFVHNGHEVNVPLGVDPEEYLVIVYDDGTFEVGEAVKNIFDEKLLGEK